MPLLPFWLQTEIHSWRQDYHKEASENRSDKDSKVPAIFLSTLHLLIHLYNKLMRYVLLLSPFYRRGTVRSGGEVLDFDDLLVNEGG